MVFLLSHSEPKPNIARRSRLRSWTFTASAAMALISSCNQMTVAFTTPHPARKMNSFTNDDSADFSTNIPVMISARFHAIAIVADVPQIARATTPAINQRAALASLSRRRSKGLISTFDFFY
jgi:hypothetical protein